MTRLLRKNLVLRQPALLPQTALRLGGPTPTSAPAPSSFCSRLPHLHLRLRLLLASDLHRGMSGLYKLKEYFRKKKKVKAICNLKSPLILSAKAEREKRHST
ncbi:hypothetical protein ACFX1R_005873 [Malus domestica]